MTLPATKSVSSCLADTFAVVDDFVCILSFFWRLNDANYPASLKPNIPENGDFLSLLFK
jgi:hypothetical protein